MRSNLANILCPKIREKKILKFKMKMFKKKYFLNKKNLNLILITLIFKGGLNPILYKIHISVD